VKARQLAERTARDYKRDAEILKTGLGHIPLSALQPRHVVDHRNERAQDARSHCPTSGCAISALRAQRMSIAPAGRYESYNICSATRA